MVWFETVKDNKDVLRTKLKSWGSTETDEEVLLAVEVEDGSSDSSDLGNAPVKSHGVVGGSLSGRPTKPLRGATSMSQGGPRGVEQVYVDIPVVEGLPATPRRPIPWPASSTPVVGATSPQGGSSNAGWATGAQMLGGSARPEVGIQPFSIGSASSMVWRSQAAGSISRSASGESGLSVPPATPVGSEGSFREVLDRRLATPWESPTPVERLPKAERKARDLALERAEKAKEAREAAAAAQSVAQQLEEELDIAEARYSAMRVQRVTKDITGE